MELLFPESYQRGRFPDAIGEFSRFCGVNAVRLMEATLFMMNICELRIRLRGQSFDTVFPETVWDFPGNDRLFRSSVR